ncbi:hypothetical protein HYR99_08245 [Candidatus Poribacteria bacterium]|nr:hypothetical protein [Candidatus Poribacteria bacterium]
MQPIVIEFRCRLTHPFMSRGHQYSNLYTVSEWILGSTLRGAILRALIDNHCTRIPELQKDNPDFHTKCDAICQIRPLFSPPTRFSFGFFNPNPNQSGKGMRTRIGIDRHTGTVAEGMLLTMEVWQYGAFTFQIMLPSDNDELRKLVCTAVEEVGKRPDDIGIGGFRGIGFGKFEIVSHSAKTLQPTAIVGENTSRTLLFDLKTPYVLDPQHGGDIPEIEMKEQLIKASSPEEPPVFQIGPPVKVTPKGISYIRRWSDEKKQKLNCVVLDPGSTITVTFDQPIAEKYLRLWQLGLGEWFYAGFGASSIRCL